MSYLYGEHACVVEGCGWAADRGLYERGRQNPTFYCWEHGKVANAREWARLRPERCADGHITN